MKHGSFAALLFIGASHTTPASDSQPVYEGCYKVKAGYVETLATSLFTDGNGHLRQQGTFSVTLKNRSNDRPEGVSKKLRIKRGTVVGELTGAATKEGGIQSPVLLHTLTDDDRNGVIVSHKGFLTSATPLTNCVVEVTERLEEFEGYGVYADLDSGSFLVVEGELDGCTGQNTFDVTKGKLCFALH